MAAYETSLRNAIVVFKYAFGLGFFGVGVFVFNSEHPYATGLLSLALFAVGTFFLSVAKIQWGNDELRYRRWFRWRGVSYSEIVECGESWVFGYIKCRRYLFPWGKIYFARGYSDESLFGWDKKVISSIRNRAGISYAPPQSK
jgi:hypothetical protein